MSAGAGGGPYITEAGSTILAEKFFLP